MKTLTQKDILEIIHYNPDTGIFSWHKKRRGIKVGIPLGCDNGFGYLRITICGVSVYAHRLAWLYFYGEIPINQIDHINGIKSDNSIKNLRLATQMQNSENKRKPQSNSTSGMLGVSWHKKANKWQVHICDCKKRIYLGLFEDINDAYNAYLVAKRKYHKFCTI